VIACAIASDHIEAFNSGKEYQLEMKWKMYLDMNIPDIHDDIVKIMQRLAK